MGAAIACFAREGFHRATMQDIVRESGLSAGSIYRYFESKQDIVAAIAEERRVAEAAVLEEAEGAVDVGNALRGIVPLWLGRLNDPGEQRWRRVSVQLWAEALRDERVMEIVRAGLDEPIEVLAALIKRAQLVGQLPANLDPLSTARVFASIFQGLVLQQAWDSEIDVPAYVDAVLAILAAIGAS